MANEFTLRSEGPRVKNQDRSIVRPERKGGGFSIPDERSTGKRSTSEHSGCRLALITRIVDHDVRSSLLITDGGQKIAIGTCGQTDLVKCWSIAVEESDRRVDLTSIQIADVNFVQMPVIRISQPACFAVCGNDKVEGHIAFCFVFVTVRRISHAESIMSPSIVNRQHGHVIIRPFERTSYSDFVLGDDCGRINIVNAHFVTRPIASRSQQVRHGNSATVMTPTHVDARCVAWLQGDVSCSLL